MIDFQDWRDEMDTAIDACDTEEIGRIFKIVRAERDKAELAADVEHRMWRLLGQWLIKLKDVGLLVETH